MDLRAHIAHEDWMRHKVLTERAALEVQLRKAKRVAELEKTFQHYFRRAMKKDAAVRRASLEQLPKVRAEQAQIEREMRSAIDALLLPAKKKLNADYAARLIDEEQMLRDSYQLAQMAQARLLTGQSRIDRSERARQLELGVAAFEGAARRFAQTDEPVNYEGLTLQREHESSLDQALGAQDEVEALERGIDELDQSVVHYDEILNTLEESPMLRATQAKLALAFVPLRPRRSRGRRRARLRLQPRRARRAPCCAPWLFSAFGTLRGSSALDADASGGNIERELSLRLRAGLGFSPTRYYVAGLLDDQARAECERHRAEEELRA